MKKQDLLEQLNEDLLEALYRFCFVRVNDSYEAQALCSDVVFALIKAAQKDGEIANVQAFIWRIAHNVYADWAAKRRAQISQAYEGDPQELWKHIAAPVSDDSDDEERLDAVYKRIAFLTKAYREVMIAFYLDGISTADIARLQGIRENTVRQRLFAARQQIRSEVDETMTKVNEKPISLDTIDFVIWGNGDPTWGDPREVCQRQFSHHVLWMCMQKPSTATEIAKALNVPTVYVEEELEILTAGLNGQYGLLRKTDNGRYAINIILFDRETIEKVHGLYIQKLPMICRTIADFIREHKAEYEAFPYLNKTVDWNLILWQQVRVMADAFSHNVWQALATEHFADQPEIDRPFSVYGYVNNGKEYGGGWDGVWADNVCGYETVYLSNYYGGRLQKHFHCGHNVGTDTQIQLALRAIRGLHIASLSEREKEYTAKAIEAGYLYREGDRLYTKILVCSVEDGNRVFDISKTLENGAFVKEANEVAAELAALIKKHVPAYLIREWKLANYIARMPVMDALVEELIAQDILKAPESTPGAEGCWMYVKEP